MQHWPLAAWYGVYFAFIGVQMPYFGVYFQAQGFSAWQISLLLSLMQIMRLVAPTWWSWLAERKYGKVKVVQISTLLCLLSFCLLFLTESFLASFLAMALMAFFWCAALPLMEALTLDHLAKTPERYGVVRLWGSVGFILAVQGIGALLDSWPIQWLLGFALALLALLFAVCLAQSEVAPTRSKNASTSLKDMLAKPGVWPLMLACFLMSAAHGAFYIFFSIHLVALEYSKTAIGALWSLGVVAEILAFLLMPRLLRRFHWLAMLLLCFAAVVLRFLLTGWLADVLALIVLAQLLHGLTFGAFHAVMVAVLHEWFAGAAQARAQALYGSISFGAGGLLGALLSGRLWDSLGAGWTFTTAAAFGALGALVIWLGVRPTVAVNTRC
jgi:PPP family 3-phenylpropionic acid transporter